MGTILLLNWIVGVLFSVGVIMVGLSKPNLKLADKGSELFALTFLTGYITGIFLIGFYIKEVLQKK